MSVWVSAGALSRSIVSPSILPSIAVHLRRKHDAMRGNVVHMSIHSDQCRPTCASGKRAATSRARDSIAAEWRLPRGHGSCQG